MNLNFSNDNFIIQIYISQNADNDVKQKSESTFKMCLQCCLQLSALEPLLYIAPPQILELILEQFAKVLPNDSTVQRMFISTGGLKKVLEIDTTQSENISSRVEAVKNCFSPDIIKFYMPMENSLNPIISNQLQPKVKE